MKKRISFQLLIGCLVPNTFRVLGKVSTLAGIAIILAFSAGSATAAIAPTNQLKFDEQTAGADAQDSIGDLIGTPVGDPAPQPSEVVAYSSPENLGSMEFDGNNYFEIENTLAGDFSICAWIKTSSIGGDQHYVGANIIESETGGYALDYGFGINDQGKLMFGNGGILNGEETDLNVMGNTVVADNTWHEVCVTRNNSTGENKLFVDSRLDATGITGVGLVTSNNVARIASGTDGAAPFVGLIDDLRLYQEVIPAESIDPRVRSLANTGSNDLALGAFGGLLIVLGAAFTSLTRTKK